MCNTYLCVGKAVEGEVSVLCDGVGMLEAVDPLAHEDGLLLAGHGLHVVAHDVVEAGEHAEALGNLGVHGPVHVVEQVERLADELVAVLQETLLDLALACHTNIALKAMPTKFLDINYEINKKAIWPHYEYE